MHQDVGVIPSSPRLPDGSVKTRGLLTIIKDIMWPAAAAKRDVHSLVIASAAGDVTAEIPAKHPLGADWSKLSRHEKQAAWLEREAALQYPAGEVPETGERGLGDHPLNIFAITPNRSIFETRKDAGPPRIKSPHTHGGACGIEFVPTGRVPLGRLGEVGVGVARFSLGTVETPSGTQPGAAFKLLGDGPVPSVDLLAYVSENPIVDPDTFYSGGGRDTMKDIVGSPEALELQVAEKGFEGVSHAGDRRTPYVTQEKVDGTVDLSAALVELSYRPSKALSFSRLETDPSPLAARYAEERAKRWESVKATNAKIVDLALDEVALEAPGAKRGDAITLTVPGEEEGETHTVQARVKRVEKGRVVCDLEHGDTMAPSRIAIRQCLSARFELQRRIKEGTPLYTVDAIDLTAMRVVRDVGEMRASSGMFLGYANDQELAFSHHDGFSPMPTLTKVRKRMTSLGALMSGIAAAARDAVPFRFTC
ncbi:MAG: hypothetical protein AAF654_11900 [Myxococcota bacterium]